MVSILFPHASKIISSINNDRLNIVDAVLKSILKRQIPFLIGGTITGSIMAYYYGFLFTIIVNSIMWYVISYLVSKYYYKSKGINDQKYLIQYGLSKIKSRNRNHNESETKT